MPGEDTGGERMLSKLKAAAQGVAGLANDVAAKSVETLSRPLEELASSGPAFERIGYRLGEIQVHCSLLPRLCVRFARLRRATEEEHQAAMADNANNSTFRTVAALLRQADGVLERFRLAGRPCSGVEIDLGVPPTFKLIFS